MIFLYDFYYADFYCLLIFCADAEVFPVSLME